MDKLKLLAIQDMQSDALNERFNGMMSFEDFNEMLKKEIEKKKDGGS